MKRNQLQLTLALLTISLFLAVLNVLSGLGGFLFGNSPALRIVATVARVAGGLAGLALLVAAIIIALDVALRPANRWRKLLHSLPLFCLGLLVVGIGLQLLNIGTVGPFTTAWILVSSLLTFIAFIVTTLTFELTTATLKRTINALSATGGLSLVALLAMLLVVGMAIATPRTRSNFGGSGGANGATGQSAPQGQQGQGQNPPQGQTGQQGQFGGPQSGSPQGGVPFEGGPGEGGPRGASTLPLIIGGVLLLIFGVVALILIFGLWRGRAALTSPVDETTLNPGRELLPTFISLAAITLTLLVVSQLVPVNRENPAVVSQVNWDSLETKQLFTNACADCHSNETQRPWYAYVAPGSWLLASHISAGRNEWNLSDLSALPGFRRQQLPNQIAENIRNNSMPPTDYLILHPAARLSDAEKAQLTQGLQQAIASAP